MMLGWVPRGVGAGLQLRRRAAHRSTSTVTLQPDRAGRAAGRPVDRRRGPDRRRPQLLLRVPQRREPADRRPGLADGRSRPRHRRRLAALRARPSRDPTVLLLPNDGDDDGAVLGQRRLLPRDRRVAQSPSSSGSTSSGINGTKADLRIRYGMNGRPDPSIRPWPASPTRQWQSPDIEVRNARNQPTRSGSTCPGSATRTRSSRR